MNVLTANLILSTLVLWIAAKIYLWPRLPELTLREGTLDLMAAITLGTVYGADVFMGAAYWIPAFWVPALLVTHYITFVVLIRPWKDPAQRFGAQLTH
jgi:hypothetical protein